ncbi:HET-domain-containing protein, partial [Corynespora cassiicola Philippines]
PPRLLNVTGDQVRLVTPLSVDTAVALTTYATLSHCWGKNPNFLTLKDENLDEFHRAIPSILIPQTFQDAITICRNIGIPYLWIDSLCILQSGKGSNEDWLSHLNEMRHIYKNGVINIAASHGSNPNAGIFRDRDPTLLKPLIFQDPDNGIESKDHHMVHKFFRHTEFSNSPLGSRGWVFQERLLSPRIVHFTKEQVFWECSEIRCGSEGFPHGLEMERPPSFSLPSAQDLSEPQEVDWAMNELIKGYTSRNLSHPDSDKFPAFAGVAEHFASHIHDEYVAGFFRNQLPEALLWHINNFNDSISKNRINPSPGYRSPSWSWAKMDCAVS